MLKKSEIKRATWLVLACIVFTILVKKVDLAYIGPMGSKVGFSTINNFFHKLLGFNKGLYDLTEILGIIPILMAVGYACVGGYQLVKRKSIKKVDSEIIAIGVLYVAVGVLYLFFEKVIINYRPVLIKGELEASYPSSHTLLALCICGSTMILNRFKYPRIKIAQYESKLALASMILILFGRFLSGAHWFSDIVGGVIISITLLYLFDLSLACIKRNRSKNK
jgi:undecaprenyl-diphosphatase